MLRNRDEKRDISLSNTWHILSRFLVEFLSISVQHKNVPHVREYISCSYMQTFSESTESLRTKIVFPSCLVIKLLGCVQKESHVLPWGKKYAIMKHIQQRVLFNMKLQTHSNMHNFGSEYSFNHLFGNKCFKLETTYLCIIPHCDHRFWSERIVCIITLHGRIANEVRINWTEWLKM